MSSIEFEVTLRPDAALRCIVFCAGIAALAGGTLLILQLPLAPPWRWAIGVIWLADGLRELGDLRAGAARVHAITLDSTGNAVAIDADGNRHGITLRTGSMVLAQLAWIRLQFRNGKRHGELITAGSAGPEDWHRLQLLWQQARESFGHPPGP